MTRNHWYRFENQAVSEPAELILFDEIGDWGTTAAAFQAELAGVRGKPLTVRINCPGGEPVAGLGIYHALSEHSGEVSVVVEGIAAEVAVVVAQAAAPGKLRMAPHTRAVVAEAKGYVFGDASSLRQTAAQLRALTDTFAEIFAGRAGGTKDMWRERMARETWYQAAEAVAVGLADEVGRHSDAGALERAEAMVNNSRLRRSRNEARMTERELIVAALELHDVLCDGGSACFDGAHVRKKDASRREIEEMLAGIR